MIRINKRLAKLGYCTVCGKPRTKQSPDTTCSYKCGHKGYISQFAAMIFNHCPECGQDVNSCVYDDIDQVHDCFALQKN